MNANMTEDKAMLSFLRCMMDLKGMLQRGAFTYGTLQNPNNGWLRVACDKALELGWVKYGVNRGNYGRHVHEGETLLFVTPAGKAEYYRLTEADSAAFRARSSAGAGEGSAFAVVPLVCLGEPVGVLCLTDGRDEQGRFRAAYLLCEKGDRKAAALLDAVPSSQRSAGYLFAKAMPAEEIPDWLTRLTQGLPELQLAEKSAGGQRTLQP